MAKTKPNLDSAITHKLLYGILCVMIAKFLLAASLFVPTVIMYLGLIAFMIILFRDGRMIEKYHKDK